MMDLRAPKWIFEPVRHEITDERISITTDPGTDFWQRTYYGFRNDNAHSLLWETDQNFTFTVHVDFSYQNQFDQCGLIIYLDSENWFKASIEYENSEYSRLGSVVTNSGYSDWATSDIRLPSNIWYRLSRRGPDFLIESSFDSKIFNQMRVFHMHALGETTAEMGKTDPPLPAKQVIPFGIYACSPLDSSFTATFSQMRLDECSWKAHL